MFCRPEFARFILILVAAFTLFPVSTAADIDWDPNILHPASRHMTRKLDRGGKLVDEIIVPGRPPANFRAAVANVPGPLTSTAGAGVLSNVPAFDWCYGCSTTSAAMIAGYYDNNGYPNMYTGPTNGGVCPLNNSVWGYEECPLSATHKGKDGRVTKGHVDDYWRTYNNCDADPFIGYWTEHVQGECTADFMGTNQSVVNNCDGATTFYFAPDGSSLHDFTGFEPTRRDGCHGMRLFAQSRGYEVSANFSQYIQGYDGNTQGFTFADFKAEIDAGRPVMIQLTGHSMVGYGYNTTGNIVYIHDTWDYNNHSMTWGGSYSGMQHYGVSVLRLGSVSMTISVIKNKSDNTPVSCGSAIVSAAFMDYFYIEADDRSSGIRVYKPAHGIQSGRVRVVGTIKTNSDGERYIEASTVTSVGNGTLETGRQWQSR